MTLYSVLSLAGVLISISLAVFVLLRDRHSLGHRIFALGMLALGIEAIFSGLSLQAILAEEVIRWQRWRLLIAASLPGIWLFFSLIFGRANYREFMVRWRWALLGAFVVPLSTATIFHNTFFASDSPSTFSLVGLLRVGLPGYIFHLAFLVVAVLILVNLEWTLRNSTGRIRWQIKFMVLGLASLFGVRIYVLSQSVLFKSVNLELELLNIGALIVASLLMFKSFFRAGLFNVNFYLSGSFLYNSFTVLFVGIYLIAVGVLAKAATYLKRNQEIPLDTFFVFLALLGLVIFLLSDRLRKRMKRFISRHFQRPIYDYQKEWMKFTQWTSSVLEIKNLCSNITKMVSNTLDVLSVTIWLVDEIRDRVELAGTTVFSEGGLQEFASIEEDVLGLIRTLRSENLPVDFDYSRGDWMKKGNGVNEAFFNRTRIHYCLPLIASGKFLGVMTIGDRVGRESFSLEDFDLLKTIADQTASCLLNLELSADLRQAKEMEAFQNMSTFFIHDLKNVASRLSLTMQNLPVYFDNPEFRNDMLRTISQSLVKINAMCAQLSSLSQKLELKISEISLNELVKNTLSSLNGILKSVPTQDLRLTQRIWADPEQIQKVLTNLILNANEAIKEGGKIRVTTAQPDGYDLLCVSDDGCGMSKEFIERSLFRPFQTTKKQGMGIGLFQSKKIVEAHGGKIEAESEEGKGTTFRVLLPLKERKKGVY